SQTEGMVSRRQVPPVDGEIGAGDKAGSAQAAFQSERRFLREGVRLRSVPQDVGRLVDVQFAASSVFVDAVPVVYPVGDVGGLLDFEHRRAGQQGVQCPRGDEHQPARRNGRVLEIFPN